MSFSLSHGKEMDVGTVGVAQEQLPPHDGGKVDLGAWFGPERAGKPLELEIGSGKGTFLLNQARQTPDINYIGIEWAKAFWKYAADRCRRHELQNVRVVRTEAAGFVRSFVRDGALRQVHIYFPDPWPKARHNKRRLVQAGFLRELWRALEPAGMVRIATDHVDYFAWMEEHAGQVADVFERLPFVSPESAGEGELVGSNFERKYRREGGRTFQGMVLRKR
ncbi:MAG: tRNA (guanosine(46)-N7)-methyltransferase TrmB [Planctomycetota bacterium]|nr:tRNA (guanosine(46)-N7)-methyltransferase TrmB [Planctomycetota bacterium]